MWEGWTGIELPIPVQELRESLPDSVTQFFVTIASTLFYLAIPVILGVLIYWFLNKRSVDRYMMNLATAFNLTNIIKFIIKQPRPWILDSRIRPAPGAVKVAMGYSLPSGHTAIAEDTRISMCPPSHRQH